MSETKSYLLRLPKSAVAKKVSALKTAKYFEDRKPPRRPRMGAINPELAVLFRRLSSLNGRRFMFGAKSERD